MEKIEPGKMIGWVIAGGLVVVVGVGIYFLVKKLTKTKNEKAGEDDTITVLDNIISDSNDQHELQQAATINLLQAKTIATKIRNAWGLLNDDEDAVYGAIQEINNVADLMLVIQQYGIYKDEDLPSAIQERMSTKEVEKINQILLNKKINYTF